MRKCDWCSKELNPKQKRFCSIACYSHWKAKNMKGKLSPAWKGGKVKLSCEECGLIFEVDPARKGARFCSQKCYGQWLSQNNVGERHPSYSRVSCKCQWCGEDFMAERARVQRYGRRFCSKECYMNWQRDGNMAGENAHHWEGGQIEFLCEWCGCSFFDWERNQRRFCSRGCLGAWISITFRGEKHPRWVGGVAVYPAEFNDALKARIRNRDKHICAICGTLRNDGRRVFPVHHIDYDKQNSCRDNLITLCNPCHGKTGENRKSWTATLLPIAKEAELGCVV